MNDSLFSSTPRGIRNNNWLNIKYNYRNHWKGQVGNDGTFCIFSDPVFGIRAAYKILKTYLKRTPDLTLKEFIWNWSSTDRDAYLQFVVRYSPILSPFFGFKRLDHFSYLDLCHLFYIMSAFENGQDFKSYIDFDVIQRGLNLK